MKQWISVALVIALAGCTTPPSSQGAYVTLVRDTMAESAERAEASENPERAGPRRARLARPGRRLARMLHQGP